MKRKTHKKVGPGPIKKRPTTKMLAVKKTVDKKEEYENKFFRKLDFIASQPPQSNILTQQEKIFSHLHELEASKQPKWFNTSYNRLNEENKPMPVFPVLCHDYIINYLREPDSSKQERCCNKSECISETMGGFRCKELLLPGVGRQPEVHGWCYLCHIYETTRLAFAQLGKDRDVLTNVYAPVIHTFIVQTDEIGEYKRSKMIEVADVVGLYGFVPLFNANNYTKKGRCPGKYYYIESDAMVFRSAQEVSKQSKFSPLIPLGMEKLSVR